MGEFDKAMHYHQMAYDISENHEDIDGKVIFFIVYLLKQSDCSWILNKAVSILTAFFLAVLNLFNMPKGQ